MGGTGVSGPRAILVLVLEVSQKLLSPALVLLEPPIDQMQLTVQGEPQTGMKSDKATTWAEKINHYHKKVATTCLHWKSAFVHTTPTKDQSSPRSTRNLPGVPIPSE